MITQFCRIYMFLNKYPARRSQFLEFYSVDDVFPEFYEGLVNFQNFMEEM